MLTSLMQEVYVSVAPITSGRKSNLKRATESGQEGEVVFVSRGHLPMLSSKDEKLVIEFKLTKAEFAGWRAATVFPG